MRAAVGRGAITGGARLPTRAAPRGSRLKTGWGLHESVRRRPDGPKHRHLLSLQPIFRLPHSCQDLFSGAILDCRMELSRMAPATRVMHVGPGISAFSWIPKQGPACWVAHPDVGPVPLRPTHQRSVGGEGGRGYDISF